MQAGTSAFLKFGDAMLAPMAWDRFALDHPDQAVAGIRAPAIKYSPDFFHWLTLVNSRVNADIKFRPNDGTVLEPWCIGPASGDCHDYAVTKRAELIKRGYPASALLLAIVVAEEYPNIRHCVLVARTDQGDFVCDSIVQGPPVLWHVRNFLEWVSIQSPDDPNRWAEVVV